MYVSPEYSNCLQNHEDLPIIKHGDDNLQVTWSKAQLFTPVQDSGQSNFTLAWAELKVEQTNQGLLLL